MILFSFITRFRSVWYTENGIGWSNHVHVLIDLALRTAKVQRFYSTYILMDTEVKTAYFRSRLFFREEYSCQ
jgi:hypothetical protein